MLSQHPIENLMLISYFSEPRPQVELYLKNLEIHKTNMITLVNAWNNKNTFLTY